MSRCYYTRIRKAGRRTIVVRYPRQHPRDSKAARAVKAAATSKAQQYINIKNGTEHLELLLYANFDSPQACFCTFTFDDAHLPATREVVKSEYAGYLKQLRKEWKQNGKALKYIYTIEGVSLYEEPDARLIDKSSPAEVRPWKDRELWDNLALNGAQEAAEKPVRFHVHCFMELSKSDMETVRAFWGNRGGVHISRIKTDVRNAYARLASYVTKERRNGSTDNGARAYTPSLGLVQPRITGHYCEEWEHLEAPAGATDVYQGRETTPFGDGFEYLSYLAPMPQQGQQAEQKPRSVKTKPQKKAALAARSAGSNDRKRSRKRTE